MSSEPRLGEAPLAPGLRIGEFGFDPATGELRGPGEPVRLRRQASRALELLAKSPGRLVSREALRRFIWGETNVDFGQGLNTCIKEVRIALGDSAEAPRYVETFPRRGYRLIARVGPLGPEPAPRLSAAAALPVAVPPGPPPQPRRFEGALVLTLAAVAVAVGATLLATATGSRAGVGASAPGADDAVERLLARGRHLFRTRDPGALGRGLALLEDAVTRSPRDARVWAALADVQLVLSERDPERSGYHADEAARAAERALALDPELAAAHAANAAVLQLAGRLAEAEAAFERAIALDPEEPVALHWYADLLRRQGRLDEAFVLARAARQADPLSAGACTSLAYVHLLRGELVPARAAFEEALSIEPDFPAAQLGLARAHVFAGDWAEALAALDRSSLPPEILRGERAYALAGSGRASEARSLLHEMQQRQDPAQGIAAVYVALGEPAEALSWLETGLANDPASLRSLPIDPRLAPLGDDPRFVEIRRRLAEALGTPPQRHD